MQHEKKLKVNTEEVFERLSTSDFRLEFPLSLSNLIKNLI